MADEEHHAAVPIERIEVAAYVIPTDRPESDGAPSRSGAPTPSASRGEGETMRGTTIANAGEMERSSAIRFDVDRVARPLSERGHVSAVARPAGPAGPAGQIEHTKERLARDLTAARARWGGVKGEAEHTARSIAVAATAALVLGAVAAAVATRSRRRHRRIGW
ncbi:hypothetical protein WME99_12295 [Sorangium sp. So ce136]|uniref:hypothetical protein n=1 Tax=Sorangium sp. So ce136 TaxID=3133284 RepID=UPI003F0FAD1F